MNQAILGTHAGAPLRCFNIFFCQLCDVLMHANYTVRCNAHNAQLAIVSCCHLHIKISNRWDCILKLKLIASWLKTDWRNKNSSDSSSELANISTTPLKRTLIQAENLRLKSRNEKLYLEQNRPHVLGCLHTLAGNDSISTSKLVIFSTQFCEHVWAIDFTAVLLL